MKYALIGCGRIAVNHLIAAKTNKFDIVAVCDIRPEKMDALLEKSELSTLPIKKYTDYKKLIDENPNLDLVAIATESGVHAEIASYVIEHDINTIVEKPIAMNMDDANKLVELARKHNVSVAANHQTRFNASVQELKKALDSGRFGKISHATVSVKWFRDEAYYKQAAWRGTWKDDGGTMMNQCIHGVDLLCWLMGSKATTVYGITRQRLHDYIEAEDLAFAIIQFENGLAGTVEGTANVYPDNLEEAVYLFGEKGTVKLGGNSANNIEIWNFADTQPGDEQRRVLTEPAPNVYGHGHVKLYAEMIDAINEKRKPYIDIEDGRNALEIVLAMYKSMKTGLPVQLPLEHFSCEDMKGTFDK